MADRFDPTKVSPGTTKWMRGAGGKGSVGYYRYKDGAGGTFKIRYRVPVAAGSSLTRQVPETLRDCPNKTEAMNALAARIASVWSGTWKPKLAFQPLTPADFWDTFEKAKANLASIRSYRLAFKNHLLPYFGKTPLVDITTGMCEDYRTFRKLPRTVTTKTGKTRAMPGASPATIRNELRYFQSMFVEAKIRRAPDNDAYVFPPETPDPISRMSFDDVDNERERVISEDELPRIMKALRHFDGNFVRPLFFTLYFTGMRLSSALKLRWADVDLEAGSIDLQNRPGLRQVKGKKYRPVMDARLVTELKRWREVCEPSEWVFPSALDAKTHRTPNAIRHFWKKLLAAAGVDNLHRHDLRHNLVTRMMELGASRKAAKKQTGHASDAAFNRYDHPSDDTVRGLVKQLETPDLDS
jgi:integrase